VPYDVPIFKKCKTVLKGRRLIPPWFKQNYRMKLLNCTKCTSWSASVMWSLGFLHKFQGEYCEEDNMN
jgi:hypothetical protein